MEKEKRNWLMLTALISMIIPAAVMGFNYFMDPLWCFGISHRYNQVQLEINERKQKTNYVTFRDFSYRGLLVGSSRSVFFNQNSFNGIRVFNYAVNGMRMDEIPPYTEYAKKRNGKDFEYIFLGLDFENAARQAVRETTLADIRNNISETNSPFYRVKTLMSIDTAKYSYRNLMNHFRGHWRYYDRHNVEHIGSLTAKQIEDLYVMDLKEITDEKKGSRYINFTYNEKYRDMLERYKRANPRSTFVVYLSPASISVLEIIVRLGLLDDYFRWISDVLAVFPEAYLFMYPNELTNDYMTYFFDPGHPYPATCDIIINAMYNEPIRGDSRFGMLITRSNFAEKRIVLERLMKAAHDPRFSRLYSHLSPRSHKPVK